ncbi:MAG: hypothetical protein R3313_05585, partial [Candidatus Saccharimonadales bacterium]|nr:hypothetical protein [Candidatus Saccharimonadales bacterium]
FLVNEASSDALYWGHSSDRIGRSIYEEKMAAQGGKLAILGALGRDRLIKEKLLVDPFALKRGMKGANVTTSPLYQELWRALWTNQELQIAYISQEKSFIKDRADEQMVFAAIQAQFGSRLLVFENTGATHAAASGNALAFADIKGQVHNVLVPDMRGRSKYSQG